MSSLKENFLGSSHKHKDLVGDDLNRHVEVPVVYVYVFLCMYV